MSSSSSSECLCGECFPYGPAEIRTPFYQTMGQPLIYYAQVHPQNHNKRSRESRKDNCFVKAFRWYTQEHLPPRPEPQSRRAELTEFAAWLDMKCDEFLEKRRAEECCHATPNDTSIEADRNNTGEPCDPCRSKTFAKRRRSPWRKKLLHIKSKEHGSTLEKCPQSLEFIMQPKDLSRPASECCQKIYPNSRSPMSSEMQGSKRPVPKSCSSVRNVVDDCECMPVEMNQNEGPNIGLPEYQRKFECKRIQYVVPPAKQTPGTSTKEVTCQCPEVKLVTVNAETQCNDSDWTNNNKASVMSYCLVPSGFPQAYDNNKRKHMPAIFTRKESGKMKDADNVSCECSLKIISKLDTESQSGKYIDVGCTTHYCTTECDLALVSQTTSINHKDKNKRKHMPAIFTRKESGRMEDADNVSCQCSLKIISKLDTESQSGKYIDVGCSCTMECDLALVTQTTSINHKVASWTTTRYEYGPIKLKREQEPVQCLDNETSTVEPTKCCFVKVPTKHYAAQTSDNAIDLGRDGVRKYPLFMKIVYADKLKEEFTLR